MSALDRKRARANFAYWDVDAVFLPERIDGPDGPLARSAVLQTATELLGRPERAADAVVWPLTTRQP